MAALIWETIPKELKSLNNFAFQRNCKPFYYKTNDSETGHNPLFFSFLSSLNNAGIVLYN